MSEAKDLMLNFRYDCALLEQSFGNESEILNMLDFWLENWLYQKSQCPACGPQETKGSEG